MKKIIATGLICIILFVSLAALSNNPTFSAIQNQSSEVHVKLTHAVSVTYSMNYFNNSNAQYLLTEGNDTIIMQDGNYTGAYSFSFDDNEASPAGWTCSRTTILSEYANHTKVAKVNGAPTPNTANMQKYLTNTTVGCIEMWLYLPNTTTTNDAFGISTRDWDTNGYGYEIVFYTAITQHYIQVWNATETINLGDFPSDEWFHLSLPFDCTNGTYQLWINGAYRETVWFEEALPPAAFNYLIIECNVPDYVDAIDWSWADDYSFNRNLPEYNYSVGAYISPIIDLGMSDPFCQDVRMVYTEPSDAALDASIAFSTDNVSWTEYSDFPIGNYTMNLPITQFLRFYINFTASSDMLETPHFTLLEFDWNATVLNEVPQLGDIAVSFDNETLEATISVYVTDPDNDTVDLFLCLPLGSIVDSQTNVVNGTIVSFVYMCEYDGFYEFYCNVTDSENSTQSSLFGFSTHTEPEVPPAARTAGLTDYLVLLFGLCFVVMIGAANIPKRK